MCDDIKTFKDMRRIRIADSVTKAAIDNKINKDAWGAKLFLGHTRAPSVGSVSKENCHPFKIGSIVGAHNGTLSNWIEIKHKYKSEDKFIDDFSVDSAFLIYMINKKGIDGLSEIQGSAATWWINLDEPGFVYFWIWNGILHHSTNPYPAFSSEEEHLKLCGFTKIKQFKAEGQVARLCLSDGSFDFVKYVEGVKYQNYNQRWPRDDADDESMGFGCGPHVPPKITVYGDGKNNENPTRLGTLSESVHGIFPRISECALALDLILGETKMWCPECETLCCSDNIKQTGVNEYQCTVCGKAVEDADEKDIKEATECVKESLKKYYEDASLERQLLLEGAP